METRAATYVANYHQARPALLLAIWAVVTLLLTPVAQAQLLSTNQANPHSSFESAETCGGCHTMQYEQWRSSMMSYSSISPPIHALELTENHVFRDPDGDGNGFGRLARTPGAPDNVTHTENQLFCQKCHAPVAVFTDLFSKVQTFNYTEENRGSFPDSHALLRQIAGIDLPVNIPTSVSIDQNDRDNAKTAMEGVTCTVCHRINGREPSNVFPRPGFDIGVANSGYLIQHYMPGELFSNLMNFGPFFDSQVNAPHGAGVTFNESGNLFQGNDGVHRPFIQTGEFCGTCHDVRIPFPDAESGEAFRRVENLFTEWRNSPWNNNDSMMATVLENPADTISPTSTVKKVTTCQDCHMSRFMLDPDAPPGDYDPGPIANNSGDSPRISNHRFVGVDRFLIHDMPQNPSVTNELVAFDISQIPQGTTGTFGDFDPSHLNFVNGEADAREILLQKAIDFHIVSAVEKPNDTLEVAISLENIGAGHNIPAGLSQERQVWIELEVLDVDGKNVYTSGYLTPIGNPSEEFLPFGEERYEDSYCGNNSGEKEYECDLDAFHAVLDNDLRIISFAASHDENKRSTTGENLGLVNYQNGFTLNGNKAFSQFIGDSIDNSNSLEPFKRKVERYDVPITGKEGPFTVNARLRFRPLPHEFLESLKQDSGFGSSRVTDAVIERNHVIEMEQDNCVVGNTASQSLRACNSADSIALGGFHTCAVSTASDTGAVYCFGTGTQGQMGNGTTPSQQTTPTVVRGLSGVKQVAANLGSTCALVEDGTVYCWGDGDYGQLGDNNTSDHSVSTPQQINPYYLSNVAAIAAGNNFYCAVLDNANRNVKCWGWGIDGGLGDGNTANHSVGLPQLIDTGWLSDVQQLEVMGGNACALLSSGQPKCWGNNSSGQLGLGHTNPTGIPTLVQSLPYKAQSMSLGLYSSCALLVTGDVYCWGGNGLGGLGNGDSSLPSSLTPVKALLSGKAQVLAMGGFHGCALLENGTVECWGWGYTGALGDGVINPSSSHTAYTPQPVIGVSGAVNVISGTHQSCAVYSDGFTECWGSNNSGQLGLGNTNFVSLPEPLVRPVVFEDAETTGLTPELIDLSSEGNEPWTRKSGTTPSGSTGPSGGANGSSWYYYMETSAGHAYYAGDEAILQTGFIDANSLGGGSTQLTYDYHMYGSNIGTLYVEVLLYGNWYTLSSYTGDQGNQWLSDTVNLGWAYNASVGRIKVRFRAVAAGGYRGDIALDNIRIVRTD